MTNLNRKSALTTSIESPICIRSLWLLLGLLSSSLIVHAGKVDLPAGLTRIGPMAFSHCLAVEEVNIPSSVAEIGDSAFLGTTDLNLAIFHGHAPTMGTQVFDNTAPEFAIHYTNGATGFATPQWLGYPAFPLASSGLQILPVGNLSVPEGTLLQFTLGTNAPESTGNLEFSAQGN